MAKKRLFFGVHLPAGITDLLKEIQDHSERNDSENALRWVAPENFHITLRFLGDTDESLLPDLIAATSTELARLSSGTVQLAKAGTFPSPKRPRVLWMGVKDQGNILQGVYTALAEPLAFMHFAPDTRPYHPHITLGYARKRAHPRAVARAYSEFLAEASEILSRNAAAIAVEQVALVESTLSQHGPHYTTLARARLSSPEGSP